MSTYESSYKSLLQGVSQQLPSERLVGQLTAQVNMVSDPVTNLRRRPGVLMRKSWAWAGADTDHVLAWFTDIAGSRVHILLNTNTGNIRILNESYVEEANLDGGAYLTAADSTRIRACAVGDEFFLANCSIAPILQYTAGGADPKNSGFFYIPAGAFGKTYSVSVVYQGGTLSATYTTPGGTGAGDAALSTPEYIAQQLYSQLSISSVGAVKFLSSAWTGASFHVVEKNTGSATAPVWVTVASGDILSMADIAAGKMRVRYTAGTTGGTYRITYQTQVGGVFGATAYTSDTIYVAWSEGSIDEEQVYTTLFTSNAPVSGDPNLIVAIDGPYVFLSRTGGLSVSTSIGSAYMIASQGGFVTSTGNLPARLPAAADGYICRVGSGTAPQYYKYVHASVEWVETAKYGSPVALSNCPISIIWNGTAWALSQGPFEGRFAGDDTSNPAHDFMQYGISGMGTYQGRLVLMSGPLVSLSAAGEPRRFFRSTVTSVINSDPIEIGSGLNSSAAYEWCIGFQKDLILFSRMYQAVLPSGNTAVTPNTATVVPTSGHEVDTTCGPINLGRTLMYCNPRSSDFFGVMEMIPSQYTDSQYVSQDSTPHLPKYMSGRCRFAVSSGVASMAMFAPTGDKQSIMVHEYHWSGDTKDQQAWHQWTFKYPVAAAYFVGDLSVLAFVQNGQIVLGTVDARAGAVDSSGVRRPFLDLAFTAEIVANQVELPLWLYSFDPYAYETVKVVAGTGALAGELVGTAPLSPSLMQTVRSWPSGTVLVGATYYSGMVPTPPQATDYQGQIVHTGKATLSRFTLGTRNSSDFSVAVSDAFMGDDPYNEATMTFSSPELELGRGLYADISQSVVPCRTDMRTTSMEVYTEGTGELNITSLEYTAKFNPIIKRR